MPISIPAFLSCLLLIGSVRAWVNAPNCTDTNTFVWAFNSLAQSPCLVAAYLSAACNNGAFSIPALLPTYSYTGPIGAEDYDICKCNTVVYNLISACAACQEGSWISYSEWSFNCTTLATPGTFPVPISLRTRVPKWAYIDTSIGDAWNFSVAEAVGDSPEVTGSVSIVPTSTNGVSQSTVTLGQTASALPSTLHSNSDSGVVAGGVVGGFVLISGVVAWLIVRRRRARWAPSTAYMSGPLGKVGQKAPQPLTQRLYDPSDPTTYPSDVYLPVSGQHPGPTCHLQPNDGEYDGLPEV